MGIAVVLQSRYMQYSADVTNTSKLGFNGMSDELLWRRFMSTAFEEVSSMQYLNYMEHKNREVQRLQRIN